MLVFTKGLNFGIDFAGGVIMEVKAPTAQVDLAGMRRKLDTLELGEIALQEFGSPDIDLYPHSAAGCDRHMTQEETTQAAVAKVKENARLGMAVSPDRDRRT